jgi:hypothetical protein
VTVNGLWDNIIGIEAQEEELSPSMKLLQEQYNQLEFQMNDMLSAQIRITSLETKVSELEENLRALSNVMMEVKEFDFTFTNTDFERIFKYPEIRHVSLSLDTEGMVDLEHVFIQIKINGIRTTILKMDEDGYHHLEFDTTEWRIQTYARPGLPSNIRVVYYATETYIT